jgi:hypothetical protein
LSPRLGLLGLLALLLAVRVLVPERDLSTPCPAGVRAGDATAVYLEPTILLHQNWVGFPTRDLGIDDVLVACFDGVEIGRDRIVDQDLDADVDRIPVPTRWVYAGWLNGELSARRDLARWRIVVQPHGPGS